MSHEERPSVTLTFGKGIKFLALTPFKSEATSGLIGSRGHRGHAMCHEERPFLTFTYGERTKLISPTDKINYSKINNKYINDVIILNFF